MTRKASGWNEEGTWGDQKTARKRMPGGGIGVRRESEDYKTRVKAENDSKTMMMTTKRERKKEKGNDKVLMGCAG